MEKVPLAGISFGISRKEMIQGHVSIKEFALK
jgi:hypothetical protein